MNIGETAGGSTCKEQENGDASNGSERPLKKARFAWQVKGKYHLKGETSGTAKVDKVDTPKSIEPDNAGSSSSGSNSENMGTEQNLEILGDYLLKQDFNTLDSVITEPNKSLLKPSTSVSSADKLPYPRYVSSYDNNINDNVLRTTTYYHEVDTLPISMVVSQNYTEDECIARWQARQMAKGFVDNTINRVLDSWIQAPILPEEDSSRVLALDVADFINNLPGDNSIENEGILMAISAHGLQNTSNSSNTSCADNNICDSSNNNILSLSPQRSLSPTTSDDESHEQLNNTQCETDNSSNDLDLPWSYSDENKNESDDTTIYPLFQDSSSLSYQYINENNQNTNANSVYDTAMVENHCDFLDAAVMFAIQSKGLTTLGTDYG